MSVICLHTSRWHKHQSNVMLQRVVFHVLGAEDLWDALVTSRQSLKRKRVTCSPRSQGLSPRAMVSTLCTRVRWEDSRLACKSTNQKTDVSANGANKCLTIADLTHSLRFTCARQDVEYPLLSKFFNWFVSALSRRVERIMDLFVVSVKRLFLIWWVTE